MFIVRLEHIFFIFSLLHLVRIGTISEADIEEDTRGISLRSITGSIYLCVNEMNNFNSITTVI